MVSVCIATYNGEKYIQDQLVSILNQLGINDEIIISDDNSSDKTIKAIKALNDDRVKIYLNEKESGYTGNFENALEKAKGRFIFLSDQDDIWVSGKIDTMVKMLINYDFVVSDAEIVDENLKTINRSIFNKRNTAQGFLNNFISIKYLGCCMAFRSKVLQKALPFPSNHDLVTHDSWLTLVSELYFKVCLINDPLIQYRRHGNNTSMGAGKSKNPLPLKVMIRVYTLYHLLRIIYK